MSDTSVTNPGLVNVADEAYDGLPRPDQAVTVTVPVIISADNRRGDESESLPLSVDQPVTVQVPTTAPVTNLRGDVSGSAPVSVDQPVTVQVPTTEPLLILNGDNYKPGGVPVDTTQNNVAGQVYGTGTPANVFV